MGNSSDKMILLGDKLTNKSKLIERPHFTVYEDQKDRQYEYWLQKSEVNNFSAQEAFLNDLVNIQDSSIVKVRNVMRGQIKEWFTQEYLFAAIIDHPKYSLLEFLQRKQQQFRIDQILSMTLQLIGAQVLLDKNSIFLGLNNIYTNDEQGNIWMLKPIRANRVKIVTKKDETIDEDSQIIGFPPPDFKPELEDEERIKLFSFGMILLQLLTNQNNSDIYDEKQQFQENIFKERFDKVINFTLLKYQEFSTFLKELLSLDKNNTFKMLSRRLLEFQQINPQEKKRLNGLLDSRTNKESVKVINYNQFSVPLAEQDCFIKLAKQNNKKEQEQEQEQVQVPQNMFESPQFFNQKKIEEVYSGQLFENKYNGKGKLTRKFSTEYTDVKIDPNDLSQASHLIKIYEGEFSLQKKHGNGKITYINGDTFEGQFENDNINGEGQFLSKNNVTLGIWKNNKLEKISNIISQDQLYSFLQSKKNSKKVSKVQQISESSLNNNPYQKLIMTSPNTSKSQQDTPTPQNDQKNNAPEISSFPYSIVESEIKYDLLDFQGKQKKNDQNISIQPQILTFYQSPQYKDGKIIYNGKVNDQQIGSGKLLNSKDQLIYEGQFKNGVIDIQGTLYNLQAFQINQVNYEDLNQAINLNQWAEYFGQFNNGKKNGRGKIKFTDKSEFFGSFVNDQITGQGEFTTPNNQKIRGNWIDGKFVQPKTY